MRLALAISESCILASDNKFTEPFADGKWAKFSVCAASAQMSVKFCTLVCGDCGSRNI